MAHPLKIKIEKLIDSMLSDINPYLLLKKRILLKGKKIVVDKEEYDLSKFHLYVIGCGKAGVSMSEAIERIIGEENIKEGLVIAPETSFNTTKIKIIQSAHPFVSKKSLIAGKKLLGFVKRIKEDSIVICLLSGGGSSLVSYPAKGLSFGTKLKFINYLILKGVNEIDVNTVRKALSAIKGGKVAKMLAGSHIINFLLLDNRGDISAVASGPTVVPQDKKTAKQVLQEHGLYKQTPASIKRIIEKQETNEGFRGISIKNSVIGDNRTARNSLLKHAYRIGCKKVWVVNKFFYRDIEHATSTLAKFFADKYRVHEKGLYAVIAGGEIPVNVEKPGRGGRNQHLAAIMTKKLQGLGNFAFASFATDGQDHIAGVHGAIITDKTIKRAKQKRINADDYLKKYDTYTFHKRLGSLIRGGLTGTNVSDVYVFLFRK